MEFKSLFFRKGIQIINYEPSAKGSFDDFEIIEIKLFEDRETAGSGQIWRNECDAQQKCIIKSRIR